MIRRLALAALSLALVYIALSFLVAAYHPRRFDIAVAQWIHDHGVLPLDYLFAWSSVLGNAEITFPLGIALGLGLLMRRHVREALTLFALPASQVLELVYKYVIVDPPPGAELHRAMGLVPSSLTGLDVRTNGSFPSGHALRATILYGLMVWLGARFGAGRSRWLVLIPAALAVLIPVSRVYVADHWLSDVLGALALGWALNLACMAMVMASDG